MFICLDQISLDTIAIIAVQLFAQPSTVPSGQPSAQPTSVPSEQPSSSPTSLPSQQPTSFPTSQPSTQPSSRPSGQPSTSPSGQPSGQPSSRPTGCPTIYPTARYSSDVILHDETSVVNTEAVAYMSSSGELVRSGDTEGEQIPFGGGGNITKVVASQTAFAALKRNGLIAWGNPVSIRGWEEYQNMSVYDPLISLASTKAAFAGLTLKGRVITFGDSRYGGTIPLAYYSRLQEGVVGLVSAASGSFSAWKRDGTVFCWGNAFTGGGLSSLGSQEKPLKHVRGNISEELHDIRYIVASEAAFAGLRSDGSLVTWGSCFYGGCARVEGLPPLRQIFSAPSVFIGLAKSGGLVAWGRESFGGMIPADVLERLANNSIRMIASSRAAVSVLLVENEPVCWGEDRYGGNCSHIHEVSVVNIVSNDRAFAGYTVSGQVVVWGDPNYGGVLPVELMSALSANVLLRVI
eukprot:gene2820-3074_t